MREQKVDYLQNNPVDKEDFPLLQHLVDSEFPSWQEYLQSMARRNTFGDQLTLFAAANLYNIDIQLVSTLRDGAQHVFHPSSRISLATTYLCHFAENHGEHYVSLIPEFNNDTSTWDDHIDHAAVDAGGVMMMFVTLTGMLTMMQVTFTMMQVTLTMTQVMLTMMRVTFTMMQVTIKMTQVMFMMIQVPLTMMYMTLTTVLSPP